MNGATGLCEAAYYCPAGTTYSLSNGKCIAGPTCSQGSFDPASGECVLTVTQAATCPYGGTLNPASDTCQSTPACVTGSVWDSSLGSCKATPTCSSGTYNTYSHNCINTILTDPSCVSGTAFDVSTGICESAPTCANPLYTFDSTLKLCVYKTQPICLTGTTFDAPVNLCDSLVSCPTSTYTTGYIYNATLKMCTLDQYLPYQCPNGAPLNTMNNECEAAPICATGSTFQQSTAQCIAYDAAFCATSDETLNGISHECEALPLCSIGKYTVAVNQCVDTVAATCPSGGFLNTTLDVCQAYPGCSTGSTLDPNGMCSSTGGVTYPAICPADAPTLDPTSHMCSTPIVYTWQPWFYMLDIMVKENGADDIEYELSTSNSGSYDATVSQQLPYVVSNWDWYTPFMADVTTVLNNIEATYLVDPSKIRIEVSDNTTPLFFDPATFTFDVLAGYPIWQNNVWYEYWKPGRWQEAALAIRYERMSDPICPADTQPNIANGQCEALPTCPLGTDGNPTLFDPTINACTSYAKLCPLNTATTQYACLDNGTGDLQCSPNTCVDLSASAPTDSTVYPPSYTNDGTVDSNGNCLGQVFIFNGKAGQCKPPGVQTNYFNCCNAANITDQTMSGSSFDTNVLDYFNTCGQSSAYAVAAINAKRAHFVGEYCVDSWPLVGCVQHANMYCDFQSQLGRIIAEQGRPQLQSFGIDGGWGTPQSPNCRGFKPDEFQMLDFSKMDLSEFTQTIQTNMIPAVQTQINTKVQNFYNTTH